MALRRQLNLVFRSSDGSKNIDSLDSKSILSKSVAEKSAQTLEALSQNKSITISEGYSTLLDVFAFAIKQEDLSEYAPITVTHGTCQLKGEFIGFRPKDNTVTTIEPVEADVDPVQLMYVTSGTP